MAGVNYRLTESCCGVNPTYRLLDENMRDHFSACSGGLPEAPLIQWAWDNYGKPGGLLLDVGSHVGSWGITWASASMNVVAFEPNPIIYQLVNEAGLINKLTPKRFTVHPLAVSDKEGVARLTAPGIDGGMASIVCDFGSAPVNEEVQTTYLDFFDYDPNVIKIDVEGAEVDVLRGARETINKHRPVIFFECWEDERGQRISELFDYASKDLAYRVNRTKWPEMWLAIPR